MEKDYITSFRVPIEKIPQAKHWKIGGRYKVIAEIEQTGINKERDYSTLKGAPMAIGKAYREPKPRYKTMVEFKVCGVKADALNSRMK